MAEAKDIISVRLLIGYLGERSQANWWPSDLLASQSEAFLLPIFQNSATLARLIGVTEAARRMHDERIGVGRVFHLFRLPETIEQSCFEFSQNASSVNDMKLPGSPETALAALSQISQPPSQAEKGPIKVGTKSDFDSVEWVLKIARHYQSAFQMGVESFPYFTDEND